MDHPTTPGGEYICDVLVIGSGAAGFATAITARKAGLDVLLVEKAPVFGGTTATSGGYVWIPGNSLAAKAGIKDDLDDSRRYLKEELGNDYDEAKIEAYLANGPKMIDFFVDEIGIPFITTKMPDYHPDLPGALPNGRSLQVKPVGAAILGSELLRLRPLPRELSLFGMGISSGSDLSHFYKFGRSVPSTLRVASLLLKYGYDVVRYGRGQSLVNGNALIARLASALFRMGTPVWTFSPANELVLENGRVAGAIVNRNGRQVRIRARRGVVLSSGGFAQNVERRSQIYTHPALSDEHISLTAPGNVGDGARMAESAGGYVESDIPNAGAWMPISRVPHRDGTWGAIIHSVNQGKPGMIAVLRNGQRFVDESVSYHDFVEHLIAHPDSGRPAGAFLICDQSAFAKYGLGYAKPFLPTRALINAGYLYKADTIKALAERIAIDPNELNRTVMEYNRHAVNGLDPEFSKGKSVYGHYLGDTSDPRNPNIAPLADAPFYAVWMYAGDIGNFAGLKTDQYARVLRKDGMAIPGLFAVGNDMASIFRGRYPGGGSLIGPAMTFGFTAARFIVGELS
jgi:succinate dehydrogenase/fumarate reductase flavoprotein subunit